MSRSLTETRPPMSGLQHYLHYRHVYAAVLLISLYVVVGATGLATQFIDVERWNLPFQAWELVVWQTSSISVILLLVPCVLVFDRFVPLTWANWRRALPLHFVASIVFSIIHVTAMFVVRDGIYHLLDSRSYSYDSWIGQFIYEYFKDAETYFYLLFFVYTYRFILLRLQGEASELGEMEANQKESQSNTEIYPERFLIRKLNKDFLISTAEVEWLEAQGNYVNLHVHDRAYPLRSTMAAIQTRLDPSIFVRVHRSYIVNINFLTEIEQLDTGDARITLQRGTQIPCSRTYRAALKESINDQDQTNFAPTK